MPQSPSPILVRPVHPWSYLTFLFLLASLCPAETLKELLTANHVPTTSFSEAELVQNVQGFGRSNEQQVSVSYSQLNGDQFTGPLVVLKYDKISGTISRAGLRMPADSICSGSPEQPYFIGGFAIYSASISPSAGCLFVLDNDLKLKQTLYGFDPLEVAPGMVLLIENMIHFAPAHAERLQLADLEGSTTLELYPQKGDALRARLIAKHTRHIPSPKTCTLMNDPCDPRSFDEDILSMSTDGRGHFAFLASQSASHTLVDEQTPTMFVSQTLLYVYARNKDAWLYCEREVPESESETYRLELKLDFGKVTSTCKPDLPVVPEKSSRESAEH